MKRFSHLHFRATAALLLAVSIVLLGCSSYPANPSALLALESSATVDITTKKNCIVFTPAAENAKNIGIAFYPGALVTHTSYAPLLRSLADKGYLCVLYKMPANLALFGSNKAKQALKDYPNIKWYLAGHSLGGAIAANSTAKTPEKWEGVIMLAAYPTKDLSHSGLRFLSIYGDNDTVLNREKLEQNKVLLTGDTRYHELRGANHAQFGNYGPQKGDGTATMSAAEQQAVTVRLIDSWISGE